MENHPHDSICGCSIDQVHDEMKPRFDQADQIASLREENGRLRGELETLAKLGDAYRGQAEVGELLKQVQ